ncbi:MAG: putative OmpR family two-component response regulator [Actinomycetia bacterium]|nr:putative OmpR family two-component response regulator [Actinomycetes bacterium]
MTQAARERAPRVLVVDDEENIAFLVCSALRLDGYTTHTAGTGQDAMSAAQSFLPDLVVLDVMLPDVDGFTLLRRLRANGEAMPVIFLTARDGTDDRVRGLTIGADDYVVKPFALEELLARVRTVLRRTGFADRNTVLRCADLELDDERHQVTRAGRSVHVSPTEYKLLRYLLLNVGQVLSKAQILDHVWNYDFGGDGSAVETYISYLRRKVDDVEPRLIHTLRGVGYTIRDNAMS